MPWRKEGEKARERAKAKESATIARSLGIMPSSVRSRPRKERGDRYLVVGLADSQATEHGNARTVCISRRWDRTSRHSSTRPSSINHFSNGPSTR